MSLIEAKRDKHDLAHEIAKLIKAFEEKHGMRVSKIETFTSDLTTWGDTETKLKTISAKITIEI